MKVAEVWDTEPELCPCVSMPYCLVNWLTWPARFWPGHASCHCATTILPRMVMWEWECLVGENGDCLFSGSELSGPLMPSCSSRFYSRALESSLKHWEIKTSIRSQSLVLFHWVSDKLVTFQLIPKFFLAHLLILFSHKHEWMIWFRMCVFLLGLFFFFPLPTELFVGIL